MHAENMRGASDLGYLYQLLAMAGWTSLPWLRSLAQPTLVLMGRDDPLVPVINVFVTQPQETALSSRAFPSNE